MENIIKHYLSTSPFPFIDKNGDISATDKANIPVQCFSCYKSCIFYFNDEVSIKLRTCPKGFNVYNAKFKDHSLILVGLLVKGKHGKLPRKIKKKFNYQIIDSKDLINWEAEITHLLQEIEDYKESCVKDSLAVYHDMTPTISLIFRTLESLIEKVPGSNFEDKVENADLKLKTLYHAINLLDNRLKMMPLISNPDAAKFGQVSKCSPYKIFDKVCRLFYESAHRRGINLNLHSDKYITAEPMVYDSFITIPFILIENAIKYSLNRETVDIHLKEKGKKVQISISSYGPVVTTENYEKIFEKGFKDPNAKKFASQGSGIGLYLANLVANAHNFEITYKKEDSKMDKNIEIGKNTFSFQLSD